MKRVGAILVGLGALSALGSVTRYISYLATRPPRDPMASEGETLSYSQFQQAFILVAIGVVLLAIGGYLLSRARTSGLHEARP